MANQVETLSKAASGADTGWLPTVLRITGGLGVFAALLVGLASDTSDVTEVELFAFSIAVCVIFCAGAAVIDALRRIEFNTRQHD